MDGGPGRDNPDLVWPCLLICQVSVYLQNWSHVLSYVSKAESTPEIAEVRPTSTESALEVLSPSTPFYSFLASISL